VSALIVMTHLLWSICISVSEETVASLFRILLLISNRLLPWRWRKQVPLAVFTSLLDCTTSHAS